MIIFGYSFKGVLSQLSWCMGYMADNARRFFHPAAINDMLSTFVPLIDGTKLDVRANSSHVLFSSDISSNRVF